MAWLSPRWLLVARESAKCLLNVEAESASRSAETDRSELAGMSVDPVPINAQLTSESRGIDVSTGAVRPPHAKQVRYAAGDLLDVVGV